MPFLVNMNVHGVRQRTDPPGAQALSGRQPAVPFAYGGPAGPRCDHSPSADLAINFRGHRFPTNPEPTINPRQNSGRSRPSTEWLGFASQPFPSPTGGEGREGADKRAMIEALTHGIFHAR